MTTGEALARVADLIEQRGWWQGAYEGPNQELCVLGALGCVVAAFELTKGSYAVEAECLNAIHLELNEEDVADWNDAPHRTKEEVVTMIRNAKRWVS